jgi:hypothetical protein
MLSENPPVPEYLPIAIDVLASPLVLLTKSL